MVIKPRSTLSSTLNSTLNSTVRPKGADYPDTPDGRYFVVRGRLWRKSNPALSSCQRDVLVKELMSARRDLARSDRSPHSTNEARQRVHAAKVELGERGPVWWHDGAPDYNRHLVKNTPYADWYAGLSSD